MTSRCSVESSLPGPRPFSPVSGLPWWSSVRWGPLISLYLEGQMAAVGGVVLAIGIVGLGLVFLLSGAITVVFAYRLENARLMTSIKNCGRFWKELDCRPE